MTLNANLLSRLEQAALLDTHDVTGWMHLYAHEAREILALAADAEALRAVKQLVLEHNVPLAVLRTLLASPAATTLQGLGVGRPGAVPVS